MTTTRDDRRGCWQAASGAATSRAATRITSMYAGHFDFAVPMLATVEALWTPQRCAALIEQYGNETWLKSTVNAAAGRVVNERLRNNDLAIVRDGALADALFDDVRSQLPATMSAEWDGKRIQVGLHGLFRPLRIYRYQAGQHFGLHQDQSYRHDATTRSLLTLMVYLNEDFDGGETDFPEQKRLIAPRTGFALWFQHMQLHAGLPVTRGTKYVLRTDVLYEAVA